MAGSGRNAKSGSSRRRSSTAAAVASGNRSNNDAAAEHKTWINFNFENCVSIAHEGLPGSPNLYRIRVHMDQGYKLADFQCAWAEPKNGGSAGQAAKRRYLRLSATAKDAGSAAVKANKSFEVLVEPLCQIAADAKPVVTTRKDKEECWIEFPVAQLPENLPLPKA